MEADPPLDTRNIGTFPSISPWLALFGSAEAGGTRRYFLVPKDLESKQISREQACVSAMGKGPAREDVTSCSIRIIPKSRVAIPQFISGHNSTFLQTGQVWKGQNIRVQALCLPSGTEGEEPALQRLCHWVFKGSPKGRCWPLPDLQLYHIHPELA